MKDLTFLKKLTNEYAEDSTKIIDIQQELLVGIGGASWGAIKDHFKKLGYDLSDITKADDDKLQTVVLSAMSGAYMMGLLETDKKAVDWSVDMKKKLKLVK